MWQNIGRLEHIKQHEKIHDNIEKVKCQFREKEFINHRSKQLHIKKNHRAEINIGILLIRNASPEQEQTEYICNTCPIPQKFKSRKTLKQHKTKMHEGRNYVVKFGKFTRYLTETEVINQQLKRVICDLCDETFSCQQNLDQHMKNMHAENHTHSCHVCSKVFRKRVQMKSHVRRVHKDPSIL